MIARKTMERRRHRYWPFYRYAGCWWQHPYCQLPSLKWMGKPTDEEAENLKGDTDMLDQVIKFARRFTS